MCVMKGTYDPCLIPNQDPYKRNHSKEPLKKVGYLGFSLEFRI